MTFLNLNISKSTAIIFFIVAIFIFPLTAKTDDLVILYVPTFHGPDSLGLNVSTVLQLQTFRTLRKSPYPNPKKLSFGDGVIMWGKETLSDFSTEAAEKAAQEIFEQNKQQVQLVLWGDTSPYADGIIVNSHLTLVGTDNINKSKLWQISNIPMGIELYIGFPSSHYIFKPIVLDSSVANLYRNFGSLKIYKDKSLKKIIGDLKNGEFTADENDSEGVRLKAPQRGWLPLPQLSKAPSEIANFSGAMIRLYRRDWLGAAELLNKVGSIWIPRSF
jgi:hypothetical protein